MKRIFSENAPSAIGNYSQATLVNNFIFTSGQLPINAETMVFVSDDIAEQARQSLQNIQSILEDNESDFKHIIKTTIFLSDINDFKVVDTIYGEFFEEGNYPSRTAVSVKDLPMGAKVEIEVIAKTKGDN